MNKLLRIFSRRHQPDVEALSVHLDGKLPTAQAQAIEAHVAACDVCRPVFSEMRDIRMMLQAVPEVDAPRSFRLRQMDVEAPMPERLRAGGSSAMRWAPAFGGMAAALFVVVLGADLLTRGGSSDSHLAASPSRSQPTGNLAAEDRDAFEYSEKTQGGLSDRPAGAGTASAEIDISTTPGCPTCVLTSRADEFSRTPSPDAAAPAGTASEPTGAPPDGDAEIALLDSQSAPEGPIAAESGPSGGTVPPVAGDMTAVGVGTVEAALSEAPRIDAASAPTPVGELSAAATDVLEDDEGNRSGYLIVEIVTGVIALTAGTALVFWRIKRRGAS